MIQLVNNQKTKSKLNLKNDLRLFSLEKHIKF